MKTEVLYDWEEEKLIMSESDYTLDNGTINQKFYITDFKIGAIGLLFEDNGPAVALIIKNISVRSADPDKYDNEEPEWKDNHSHSVEFITQRDCYYIGFDEIRLDDIEVSSYC